MTISKERTKRKEKEIKFFFMNVKSILIKMRFGPNTIV